MFKAAAILIAIVLIGCTIQPEPAPIDNVCKPGYHLEGKYTTECIKNEGRLE